MKRILLALFALIGLGLLAACATPDVLPLTPTVGEIPVAQNTVLVPSAAAPPSTFTPTSAPTTLPEPPFSTPLPGWLWYQSGDGAYTITYPSLWQVQNSGAGGTVFSAPETGSQVRISRRVVPTANEAEGNAAALPDEPSTTSTPSPPTCTDWLARVSTHPSDFPGVPVGLEMALNATFGGQPAFFHFSPAPGGGGGSSAVLLFCAEGTVVSLYFQSATDALVPDEAVIYQQMITSLIWQGHAAASPDIPTAWMTGETLVIHWPQLKPVFLSAEKQLFYEAGFAATVLEFDVGTFEVMTDEGEVMRVRGRSYTFSRHLPLGQENGAAATFPEPGDHVFLVGYPVTTADGEPFFTAQYLAVERDGQWQTVGFQTTFDLAYESPDPDLFNHYPQDQPIHLRFLGTVAQIMPYLVDETGNPMTEDELADIAPSQWVLAYGVLLTPENPHLQLEELYALEGTCYPIAAVELDCYPWRHIYPPNP